MKKFQSISQGFRKFKLYIGKPSIKVLFLSLTIITFLFTSLIDSNIKSNEKQTISFNTRSSRSWFFNESIEIDDLSINNWEWVETQEWCDGSGTIEDPYVIENITIDAKNSGSCLKISNSQAYFIIRNCTLYNSSLGIEAGINLINTSNGQILENNCSNNYSGILLENSNNTIINQNLANNNNWHGIFLSNSNYNLISENTLNNNSINGLLLNPYCNDNIITNNNASHNTESGICLITYCNNNYISKNKLVNNSDYGIYLWSNCIYNIISENNIYDNGKYGIYLRTGCESNSIMNNNASNINSNNQEFGIYIWNCVNNEILENIAQNNTDSGIYIYTSSSNTISGNAFINNTKYGISLKTGNQNEIWENSFINNGINAIDNGTDNMWYYNEKGNYWDDYPDIYYINGIGKWPYNISGTAGSSDNFPLNDSTPVPNFMASEIEVVAGQTIQFTYNGIGGNLPFYYKWDFGDGSSGSKLQNPEHIYETAGIYDISLSVVDIQGDNNSISRTEYIEVLPDSTPLASINVNATIIYEGECIQFIYTGSGGNDPLTFDWDFGDETPHSSLNSTLHSYKSNGTYIVSLIVTDRDGDRSTANMTIFVKKSSNLTSNPEFAFEIILITLLIIIIPSIAGISIFLYRKKNISKLAINRTYNEQRFDFKGNKYTNAKSNKIIKPLQNNFLKKDINKERKEMAQTESEMIIKKQEIICLVHKGPIRGENVYVCPHCSAFYCKFCIKTLREKGEKCWVCNNNLD